MSLPIGKTLDVPGARLYYETQGAGPTLMLIGHPMGMSGFAAIAPLLEKDFTVVTYDPRGFYRSTIDDPDQDGDPDVLADDVRRVLDAVGGAPAHVFGSSGGAVAGLALVTRFPDHVATLVAHEPPVGLLLSDGTDTEVAMHEIYNTFLDSGVRDAWQSFVSFTGLDSGPPPAAPDTVPPPSAEEVATSDRFFRHGLLPIALYDADIDALQAAPSRIIVAGGMASRGEFPQRTAVALAQRLGTELVEFPGGHVGFISDAHEFVRVLRGVLL
jgi:pimeloyl-ACP methyl ester carboxylesterase